MLSKSKTVYSLNLFRHKKSRSTARISKIHKPTLTSLTVQGTHQKFKLSAVILPAPLYPVRRYGSIFFIRI